MKKVLALLLAMVLVLSLVACTTTTKEPVSQSDTNTEDSAKTDEKTGDSTKTVDDGETIKIGFSGALSGAGATFGNDSLNAVKLGIKQWNAKGGVLGKQIELFEYDDQGNTEMTVKNVTRLVQQDKVCGIIGTHLSSGILASSDINEEAHVIQIGPGTSSIWSNVGLNYTFRPTICSDLFNQGVYDSMVKMGATKVATMTADTEYAQTATATVTSFVENDSSMEIVAAENFTTGDTDFSGQVTKILAQNPDAIVVNCGSGEEGGIIVKAFRMQGYTGYMYGIEAFADTQYVEMAGEYADNMVLNCAYFVPFSGDAEDALNEYEHQFLLDYKEEYNVLPSADSAYRSYDGINILLNAIAFAESTDGDAIRQAIYDNEFVGIGGTFDYTEGSVEGLEHASSYIFQNGKPILLDDYLAKK